jgi:hypothetical protein
MNLPTLLERCVNGSIAMTVRSCVSRQNPFDGRITIKVQFDPDDLAELFRQEFEGAYGP